MKPKEVLKAFNKLREKRNKPPVSTEEFERLLNVDKRTHHIDSLPCVDSFDGPLIKHFRDD